MKGTWEPCTFCGRIPESPRSLNTNDHFPMPKRHGGTTVIPLCRHCHQEKDAGLHWEEKRFRCGGSVPESIQHRLDEELNGSCIPFKDWATRFPDGDEDEEAMKCIGVYRSPDEAADAFFEMIREPTVTKELRILAARALVIDTIFWVND